MTYNNAKPIQSMQLLHYEFYTNKIKANFNLEKINPNLFVYNNFMTHTKTVDMF